MVIVNFLVGHWLYDLIAFTFFGVGMLSYLLMARPADVALDALGRISSAELSLDSHAVFTPTTRAGNLYAPIVNRIMGGIRRFLPAFTTEYLAPLLLVADIDTEPDVWLGEVIFAGGLLALVSIAAVKLFALPTIALAAAFVVPLLRILQVRTRMNRARNGVRATMPQLFTIAATVARVTSSIEGPNGLLSYMVNLIDSPASDLLRKVLIRAASTNRSVEEVMDEFAGYYKAPALQGLAANIRLARRKGGAGLPQAIANASIRLAEQQIDQMVNAAAIKSQFSMMAVVIFNMPGLMIMLLAPAVARLICAFSGSGNCVA